MTRITLPRMSVLALLVVPALAWAQGTVPATEPGAASSGPASQPAVPADYSSPKAAATTLADAVIGQDMGVIRNSLVIGEEDKATVDVLLEAFGASARLNKAVRTKYGEKAYRDFRGPGDLERVMAARKTLIDTAEVKTEGDAATMTFHPATNSPAQAAGSLRFKKVGEEWKVDAGSLFGLKDPARAARVQRSLPTLQRVGQIYNQTAGDIEAGKYASVQEVQNAMVPQVIATLRASTQPTTGAATEGAATTEGKESGENRK